MVTKYTPAENFDQLVSGRPANWIPFSLDVGAMPGLTNPIMNRFREETGAEDPAEYFDYDFRTFSLTAKFGGDDARTWHSEIKDGTTFDEWGIGHWAGGTEGTYERILPPLLNARTVQQIEALPSPILTQGPDVTPVTEYHRRGYPVFGYAGSIYEWSWWLRGMDKFMMDLLLQPVFAEALLQKVKAYTKKLALASGQAGIDVLCFYDDVGMQSGMQISPDLWRKYVKTAWKEVLDAVRAETPRAKTFLHSCGNIREIIPDIIDLGFDVLHPLQPECMDLKQIRRDFSKYIVICATISAQRTLPFGKPKEVRAEVRRLKSTFAPDNRCILCPSNMVQPETPWENILAFVDEARAAGA